MRSLIVTSMCLALTALSAGTSALSVHPADQSPPTGDAIRPGQTPPDPAAVVRGQAAPPQTPDYRIGPDDLLTITVLQAPELNTSARVSGPGDISLPLVGTVRVIGLTTGEAEAALEERLRHKYIRDPQVSVLVAEMQSHAVSVVGAVQKPGVFQIRGARTLLEVLSLAEGLAPDAGESVIVLRNSQANLATPAAAGINQGQAADPVTTEVKIKALMDSGDPGLNVPIYPGDVVTVQRASVIYVVGEVNKPGAYAMLGNAKITVLGALALGMGVTPTAAKGDTVILRSNERGERTEIALDLDRILKSKDPDVPLEPQDVLFVPVSGGKALARATIITLTRIFTLRGVIIP